MADYRERLHTARLRLRPADDDAEAEHNWDEGC
jgi:hypothetical protein